MQDDEAELLARSVGLNLSAAALGLSVGLDSIL